MKKSATAGAEKWIFEILWCITHLYAEYPRDGDLEPAQIPVTTKISIKYGAPKNAIGFCTTSVYGFLKQLVRP